MQISIFEITNILSGYRCSFISSLLVTIIINSVLANHNCKKVENYHSYHPKMKSLSSVFWLIFRQIIASLYFILQVLRLDMVIDFD